MCRLFGLHAGKPVDAEFWLLEAPDSLAAQSHRNPDGAGIGTFGPAGRPEVSKQPIAAWQDTDFARAARRLRGTTFVAHVRYASTGAHTMANTHPFLQTAGCSRTTVSFRACPIWTGGSPSWARRTWYTVRPTASGYSPSSPGRLGGTAATCIAASWRQSAGSPWSFRSLPSIWC